MYTIIDRKEQFHKSTKIRLGVGLDELNTVNCAALKDVEQRKFIKIHCVL